MLFRSQGAGTLLDADADLAVHAPVALDDDTRVVAFPEDLAAVGRLDPPAGVDADAGVVRSEERRVGKEGRSRWSP